MGMKVEEEGDNEITRICDLRKEVPEKDIPGDFKEYQT